MLALQERDDLAAQCASLRRQCEAEARGRREAADGQLAALVCLEEAERRNRTLVANTGAAKRELDKISAEINSRLEAVRGLPRADVP